MSLLLHSVIARLSGQGGDPVVPLQTAFGGGKTHTMMAVLHMVRAEEPVGLLSVLGSGRAREPEHDVVSIHVDLANVDLAKLLARARPAADA